MPAESKALQRRREIQRKCDEESIVQEKQIAVSKSKAEMLFQRQKMMKATKEQYLKTEFQILVDRIYPKPTVDKAERRKRGEIVRYLKTVSEQKATTKRQKKNKNKNKNLLNLLPVMLLKGNVLSFLSIPDMNDSLRLCSKKLEKTFIGEVFQRQYVTPKMIEMFPHFPFSQIKDCFHSIDLQKHGHLCHHVSIGTLTDCDRQVNPVDFRCFSQMRSLVIRGTESVDSTKEMTFPPLLTHLTMPFPSKCEDLPVGLLSLTFSQSEYELEINPGDLPEGLKTFVFDWECTLVTLEDGCLPQTLTYLKLPKDIPSSNFQRAGLVIEHC
jgi:hypothetical protein